MNDEGGSQQDEYASEYYDTEGGGDASDKGGRPKSSQRSKIITNKLGKETRDAKNSIASGVTASVVPKKQQQSQKSGKSEYEYGEEEEEYEDEEYESEVNQGEKGKANQSTRSKRTTVSKSRMHGTKAKQQEVTQPDLGEDDSEESGQTQPFMNTVRFQNKQEDV